MISFKTSGLTTTGHRWISVAAILGACFVILHLITIATTCAVVGFDWGFNAWFFDIAGFLAGAFFAIQCRESSRKPPSEFKSGNRWICIWALATCLVRVLDTLMLLGLVEWSEFYITPDGAVFWANFISEIIFGMSFAVTALIGSTYLLLSSSNETTADPPTEQNDS
ncbi:MAG: hypothetical protein AAF664_25110, partial [Planctomycetota bacterium]